MALHIFALRPKNMYTSMYPLSALMYKFEILIGNKY